MTPYRSPWPLPMAALLGLGLLIPQTRSGRNISLADPIYPQHFVDKSGRIAARLDENTAHAARQRPAPDNRGVHGVRMMKIHASGRITLRAGDLTRRAASLFGHSAHKNGGPEASPFYPGIAYIRIFCRLSSLSR